MTDKYQPCDTHINGALKSRLRAFWSENEKPGSEVSLAATIKETTKILSNFSTQFIQRSFEESLVTTSNKPRAVVHPPNMFDRSQPSLVAHNQHEALDHISNIMSTCSAFVSSKTG